MNHPTHPESVEFGGLVMGREAVDKQDPASFCRACEKYVSGPCNSVNCATPDAQAALAAPVAATIAPIAPLTDEDRLYPFESTKNGLRHALASDAGELSAVYLEGKRYALAPVAAQPAAKEPIYQHQMANGHWIDQSKESYDYNVKMGQAVVRVVYTRPAAAQPVTDAEVKRLISEIRGASEVILVTARLDSAKLEPYKNSISRIALAADMLASRGQA